MSANYISLLGQGQHDHDKQTSTTASTTSRSVHDSFWTFCHDCADTSSEEAKRDLPTYKSKLLKTTSEVALMGAFVYGFDWLMHDKFCNFLYQCGCTYIFAGGWDDCNVHNASGPKCPWCMASASVAWTTVYLGQAVMFLTYLAMLRNRRTVKHTSAYGAYVTGTDGNNIEGGIGCSAGASAGSDNMGGGAGGAGGADGAARERSTGHWSNCWTGLDEDKHPLLRMVIRCVVAPIFMYFLTGTLVGLLFFLFNPHYHVFIFDFT